MSLEHAEDHVRTLLTIAKDTLKHLHELHPSHHEQLKELVQQYVQTQTELKQNLDMVVGESGKALEGRVYEDIVKYEGSAREVKFVCKRLETFRQLSWE